MKECPYCLSEIPDQAKKCKHCWEWVVDNNSFRNLKNENNADIEHDLDDEIEDDNIDDDNMDDEDFCNSTKIKEENLKDENFDDEDIDSYDEDEKNDINPQITPKPRSYSWIWWIIIWFFVIVWVVSSIKSDKEKEENKKVMNDYFDKAIESNWEMEISDVQDAISNYKPQNSTEEEIVNELLDIMDDLSKKVDGISEDAFFIEDKDLHNLNLLNSSISQLKQFKSIITDYIEKCKDFWKKWWLEKNGGAYSYSELLSKMEEYAESMLKFSDNAIQYYSYVITIQNYFYYDEEDDQIYFYSDSPDYALDEFNDLYKKCIQSAIDFMDADEKYNDYYMEYLKHSKAQLN